MTSGDIIVSILTILAIFTGPIAAVRISRHLDDHQLKKNRRMDVFRTLMRTRRVPMVPDHVGALNVVEIEFQDERAVVDAWREYLRDLGDIGPTNPTPDQMRVRFEARSTRLTKLLHEMAKALNFEIEQMDIFQGGYAPQGWLDNEQAQKTLRTLLLNALADGRGIPVAIVSRSTSEVPPPNPSAPPTEAQ